MVQTKATNSVGQRFKDKNGRFARRKVVEKKQKALVAMARGKQRKMQNNKELEEKNLEPCQNLEGLNCKDVLESSMQESLPSVPNEECKNSEVNCTTKTEKSTYDINTKAVLGTVNSGIGCVTLNKFLSCLNIPTISNELYERYKQDVRLSIEKIADDDCSRIPKEESNLVINNIDNTTCVNV